MGFSLGLPKVRPIERGPRDANGRRINKRRVNKAKNAKNAKKANIIEYNIEKIPNYSFNNKFWKFPLGINVPESIEYKFSTVNYMFNYTKIKKEITSNIKNIYFKFTNLPEQFIPPLLIRGLIQSYYTREEYKWNCVRGLYLRLFKLKKCLTPLIFKWRIAECIKHVKNTEDPVTLEVPKKLVRIIDLKNRNSFIYDANTIRRAIENKILFSDYMFAEPQQPVNLLTNLPLTYGQLMSVIFQCKAQGEYSWILEDLRLRNGNLETFTIYNKTRINIEAIKVFFKKSNTILRETVIDFFNAEAEYADLHSSKISSFILLYDTKPSNIMVRKWINHTREYYIAKELNNPIISSRIDAETDVLMNMIYRIC